MSAGEGSPPLPPVWDAHSCVPLHPDFDLAALARHRAAGCRFVSVNVGMDLNPPEQILQVLASFRRQLAARPDLFLAAETAADVTRAVREEKLAVAFDLEGGRVLAGRPDMVFLFRDLGVRQIHLAYNRDNELGGGSYGADVPLTATGRAVVRAVHEAGLFMDLSHTGRRTSLDILDLALGPVVFSHANPRALRDDPRNVEDERIRLCAESGGVFCVTGVGRFLPDPAASAAAIADCIDHVVELVGPAHVGLSLDFEYPADGLDDRPTAFRPDLAYDPADWWPPAFGYGGGIRGIRIAPPERIPAIARELRRRGYGEADLAAILGGNMHRLAARLWRAGHTPRLAGVDPAGRDGSERSG